MELTITIVLDLPDTELVELPQTISLTRLQSQAFLGAIRASTFALPREDSETHSPILPLDPTTE